MPALKVGDKLPSACLCHNEPGCKVNISELCSDKRVVIFGVPGAFTPTCQEKHVPGYLDNFDKFMAKGIDLVICITVNDAFVVKAWEKQFNKPATNPDKFMMLSDCKAALTKALGLELDLTDLLGSVRCTRFALYADKGVIKAIEPEPNSGEVTVSGADAILAKI